MKRLWGIRHLRWAWGSYRVHRWARMWAQSGIGLGIPNSADLKVLDAIWRGER